MNSTKSVEILLSGATYAEHKGSAALLISTISNIADNIPNSHFLFCSFTPEIDQRKLKLPNVKVIPYGFRIRSFDFLLSTLYLRLTKNRSSNIEIINSIRDADIIIDISGDAFSSEYGTEMIISAGSRILTAKFLRKPIVIFCQSIGPFEGFVHRHLAKLFLKFADLVISREYVTARYLHSLGIKTHVCADQAFLLQPSPIPTVLKLPYDKPIIGVNLSQYIDAKYGGDQPTNRYRIIMTQFLDLLVERYDANIVIIPETKNENSEIPDDYSVSKEIVDKLKHKERVTIVEGDHPPSVLKSIAGSCEILISPRFHLVIFATSQYVPSIAISYNPKSYGIMEMLGQSEYVINHQDLTLDLLMSKVEELWTNKDRIRKNLSIKMKDIQARARYAAKLVQIVLEKTK